VILDELGHPDAAAVRAKVAAAPRTDPCQTDAPDRQTGYRILEDRARAVLARVAPAG